MAEGEAMAEKILSIIENVVINDPELQEFTIVPTEHNTKNKSPVLYEEHNMGLESWCVKHVYNYACSILFSHRESLSKRRLSCNKMEELNRFLIGVILINPDMSTFWNMKRDLILSDVLNVENELHFSGLVLSNKSKCNEAFSYRRWLLKRILKKNSTHNLGSPLSLLQNEFFVAHETAIKESNNYHSWNHRIWCMENIAVKCPNIGNIIDFELSYCQEWINLHVSEHIGYHYRQYLIKLVKNHPSAVSLLEPFYKFLIKHLNLINDGDHGNLLIYLLGKQNNSRALEETSLYVTYISVLMYDLIIFIDKLNNFFPEHESVFYYRRFVIYHLLEVAHEYHGMDYQINNKVIESDVSGQKNIINSDGVTVKSLNSDENNQWPRLFKVPFNKVEASNLYKILTNAEKQFILKNMNSKYGAVHNELTKRYQKWLKYVAGFP